MALFFKTKHSREHLAAIDTAVRRENPAYIGGYAAGACERELYSKLREQVPIIDACIEKTVRLAGGFKAIAEEPQFQDALDRFVMKVRVGASGEGLQTFSDCCIDSLITHGSALAEIIYDDQGYGISGIYVAPMEKIGVKLGKNSFEREYFTVSDSKPIKLKNSENLLFAAASPTAESPCGVSVLRGLPGLSGILLRIYECIGQNFDRVGNVRYAVTYKPTPGSGDGAFLRERAKQIAKEWSSGMSALKNGEVRDFVAVGDVDIKVIGADNQIIDTEVPVRQILEQLISKLGIPPFLLGLSWSSTERMSMQQTDILTSELEYYRRLITPLLIKLCTAHLRLCGSSGGAGIEWDNINLQDESELSLARLRNAQARKIEISNEKEMKQSV